MSRTVNIGAQDFAVLREGDYFYIDKTDFIREWWEAGDTTTLICRPRRFGKTLNLSMVKCFFSTQFANRGEELFAGLDIWGYPGMRNLQGSFPVVSLTFSDCKGGNWQTARAQMCRTLRRACAEHAYILQSESVDADLKLFLARVDDEMDDATATASLSQLCFALEQHHGKKPIVLLDEYDTPMQEAWMGGWWKDAVAFQRSLFNSTFKACPALGRGLITGITRISRESVFSDLNNLAVVTTTVNAYETAFGFTEDEVFVSMDEMGLSDYGKVRDWYDGFRFGTAEHIYNPWSIINYLKRGSFEPYWANSSSNMLVSQVVRLDASIQSDFEDLLAGKSITKTFDEQIVFSELTGMRNSVWSLLLASGYLKACSYRKDGDTIAELRLTNHEVEYLFDKMVSSWFDDGSRSYPRFAQCLLNGEIEEANAYLADLLGACISSFDAGSAAGGRAPVENFYHGLVLGLLVELRGRYEVTSNRESGYGRYDIMLCPGESDDPAYVIEFKVANRRIDETIEEALASAKSQIAGRDYARQLRERGIEAERIIELGCAFSGKEVLLG